MLLAKYENNFTLERQLADSMTDSSRITFMQNEARGSRWWHLLVVSKNIFSWAKRGTSNYLRDPGVLWSASRPLSSMPPHHWVPGKSEGLWPGPGFLHQELGLRPPAQNHLVEGGCAAGVNQRALGQPLRQESPKRNSRTAWRVPAEMMRKWI